jgi:hypothetical protein
MIDKEVLAVLRGSPTGTTEARFALMGVPRKQLDKLVRTGKARVEVRTLRHRALKSGSIDVPWFFAS